MKKYSIGIDIGGTNIRAVLWDGESAGKREKIPTPKTEADFKNKTRALAATLGFGKEISGIGIAVAGIVAGMKIKKCPNIAYLKNFEVRRFGFNCPIMLDNDARAFLRANLAFRKSDFRKNALALTIGTGVGRAFASGGHIKSIKQFERPERWERKYREERDLKDDARLAFFLGENISKMLAFYKPEIIIVGGGVVARKIFFKLFKAELKTRKMKARVVESRLGEYAGAIGAAMLIK